MQPTRILIVEDEPIVAMDLRQQIEEMGYQVTGIAETADEALMAAEETQPDLALLDISIEGSMDGVQTAKILRQWFNVPCVFATAYSDKHTISRAARQMPYGYLTKPIRANELAATLQVALAKARADSRERVEHAEMVAAVDALRDGLLLVSVDGRVLYWNAALESLTGMTLREAQGRSFTDVLHLKDENKKPVSGLASFRDGVAELFGWRMETATSGELPIDLTMTSSDDTEGRPRAIVFTVRDATERLRQQALNEAQEERSTFDGAPMAMAQLDNAGRILRVNRALLEAAGVGPEKLLGRSLTSLSLDPDPRIARNLMHKLLQEGTVLAAPRQPRVN